MASQMCLQYFENVVIIVLQNVDDQLPLIMSFDGNFGLVHKRSSGRSFEQPLHGDRAFVDDKVVRDYMAGCSKECKDDDVVDIYIDMFCDLVM